MDTGRDSRPALTRLRAHGGLYLACEEYGQAGATPVLLLHGGGQTRRSWGGLARRLGAEGYRAIAADLRGHGESEWARPGDYRIDDFAADVRTLSAALPALPVLVGASLGGLASLVAAGESASPIARAIVLVDVAPKMERAGVERVLTFMRSGINGFDTVADAQDALVAYAPNRRPPGSTGLRRNLRQGTDGKWYWHWDPAFLEARFPGGEPTSVTDHARMRAAAAQISLPTLLARGASSDVVSEASVAELRDLIPHAETVDVAGTGHMVTADRNDLFAGAVLDFLRALDV